MYPYSSGDPPWGVVSDSWALGDYTFPHEIGHLVQGKHQQESGSTVCHFTGRGYEIGPFPGDPRTMMAVCSYFGMCTQRQLYFSNPNQQTNDGEPRGQPAYANTSKTLKQRMPDAANYLPNPQRPPAPASVNVQPMQCYGQNLVSWSDSDPVHEYQVFRSDTSSFANQILIYKGRNNALGFFVGQSASPDYIRVRACNAGGCSAYTPGDQAGTYTDGCL